MQSIRLIRTYAATFVVLFVLGVDVYVGRIAPFAVRPVLLFLLTSIPVCLVFFQIHTFRTVNRKTVVSRWKTILPLALLSILAATSLSWNHPGAPEATRAAILPALSLATVLIGGMLRAIVPSVRFWRLALGTAFLLLEVSLLIDAIVPGTFSKVIYRSGGIAVNSNAAALLLVCLLATLLRWNPRDVAADTTLLVLTASGVALTLSRSGMIVYVIITFLWIARHCRTWRSHDYNASLVKWSAIIVAVGFAAAILLGPLLPVFQSPWGADRRTIWKPQRSDSIRYESLLDSLDTWLEAPFLGHGAGHSTDVPPGQGPHNMYLALAIDYGIPAAVLYTWFLAALWFSPHLDDNARALVLVVAVYGLFSHTLLYNRSILLLLGLAIGATRGREARIAE